jgi:hypothetical protein
MTELQASRTLVKSPPELWAECSDAASLARHLDGFGDIRITRLEPETAVAWEGESARGTVRIEPAGWGTKVILTAVAEGEQPPPIPIAVMPEPADPDPPAPGPDAPPSDAQAQEPPPQAEEPPPIPRRRFARFRAFLRGPEPSDEPAPPAEDLPAPAPEAPPPALEAPAAEPEAPEPAVSATEAALAAALDSLGQAHHRPFSRA